VAHILNLCATLHFEKERSEQPWGRKYRTIALLHYDVTIKTFIKILLFNARDYSRLAGTKQRKFTVSKTVQIHEDK